MSTPKQDAHIARTPVSLQRPFKNAYEGNSKASAIKAKCIDCVGCEDHERRIGNCFTEICPLWAYRPYVMSSAAIKDREVNGIILTESGITRTSKERWK